MTLGEFDKLDRTVKSIRIRPANEKDLPSLVILAEEFMPREADNEKRVNVLKQALRNPDYELLVAELEGEIVGFIANGLYMILPREQNTAIYTTCTSVQSIEEKVLLASFFKKQ